MIVSYFNVCGALLWGTNQQEAQGFSNFCNKENARHFAACRTTPATYQSLVDVIVVIDWAQKNTFCFYFFSFKKKPISSFFNFFLFSQYPNIPEKQPCHVQVQACTQTLACTHTYTPILPPPTHTYACMHIFSHTHSSSFFFPLLLTYIIFP